MILQLVFIFLYSIYVLGIDMTGAIITISYSGEASRGIMLQGQGLMSVTTDIEVLIFFSLVFISSNVVALKKQSIEGQAPRPAL